MRPRRLLAAAVALGLALPVVPSVAGTVAVPGASVRSVPLSGPADLGLRDERLVGVTWDSGSPTVRYRWHTPAGWGPWQEAEADTARSPQGTPGTEPLWRPRLADRVQLTSTPAPGLRVVTVRDRTVRRLAPVAQARAASARSILGEVHPRSEWGAPAPRTSSPYAASVQAVAVHHTVNDNGYSREDVPRILRADFAYHVETRGWNDVGYNLLVDAFGRIWEGRAGGIGKPVVGAHTQGFNTGTLGVAMIGDLTKASVDHATKKAFARITAYAAKTWSWDPTGKVTLTSRGAPRYASGVRARLPRVFGHQQTGVTACPGTLMDDLPDIRALAEVALGPAPKIGTVSVSGAPVHAPSPLTVRAPVSPARPWVVQVTDGTGRVVASAAGTGATAQLTWDGFAGPVPALPGSYSWRVTVDDRFHDPVRRTGTFEVGLPLVPV